MRLASGIVIACVLVPLAAACGGTSPAPPTHQQLAGGPSGKRPPVLRCGAASLDGPRLTSAPGGDLTQSLRLPGVPDGIATTPDGRFSFVAIQSGPPRIAVLGDGGGGERLLRTVAVPAYAGGLRVTPDGRELLGAAGRGALVIDVAAAVTGAGGAGGAGAAGAGGAGGAGAAGAGGAYLGTVRAPASVAGGGPGAAEVAVSGDSRYAFVTLEGAGRIVVFDLAAARRDGFAGADPGFVGSVPTGAGALGIAASPDGRRLYSVSESARDGGHVGALFVVDLHAAIAAPGPRAVLAAVPVRCAPVRVAVSPDGSTVWVTARDGNSLLGYSPGGALRSVTRVGAAPLGLAITPDGRRVLVADSDLSHVRGGRSEVSIVSVSADSTRAPTLAGWVPAGQLADAVSITPGGRALVTASDGREVRVIDLSALPVVAAR